MTLPNETFLVQSLHKYADVCEDEYKFVPLLTYYQFVNLSFCTLQQQIWLCVATEGPSFISAEGHILHLSQMFQTNALHKIRQMCLFLLYRRSAVILCQWIIIKDKTLTSIFFFYSFLGSYYNPLKFCESEEKISDRTHHLLHNERDM